MELPANVSSMELFDAALAQSVRIAPGTMFSNLNRCDPFFRICSGWRLRPTLKLRLPLGRLTQELAER
ncbi:hypothetical protein ACU4HD_48250 [Cupriavidus basilensis]